MKHDHPVTIPKECLYVLRNALRETDDMNYEQTRAHLEPVRRDLTSKLTAEQLAVLQLDRAIAHRLFLTAVCTTVAPDHCLEILKERDSHGYEHITEKSRNWKILAHLYASSGYREDAIQFVAAIRDELEHGDVQDSFVMDAVKRLVDFETRLHSGNFKQFRAAIVPKSTDKDLNV